MTTSSAAARLQNHVVLYTRQKFQTIRHVGPVGNPGAAALLLKTMKLRTQVSETERILDL